MFNQKVYFPRWKSNSFFSKMSLFPHGKRNLSFLNLNDGVLEKSLQDACSTRGKDTQRSLPTLISAVARRYQALGINCPWTAPRGRQPINLTVTNCSVVLRRPIDLRGEIRTESGWPNPIRFHLNPRLTCDPLYTSFIPGMRSGSGCCARLLGIHGDRSCFLVNRSQFMPIKYEWFLMSSTLQRDTEGPLDLALLRQGRTLPSMEPSPRGFAPGRGPCLKRAGSRGCAQEHQQRRREITTLRFDSE